MNSYQKGNLSEAKIVAKLLELGKVVFKPVGEGFRYDLLIDNCDGTFTRVQCKTARVGKNGTIIFATGSRGGHNKAKNKGYVGQADVFMVYAKHTDKVYVIPVESAPIGSMSLRIIRPLVNTDNINWADKYVLK